MQIKLCAGPWKILKGLPGFELIEIEFGTGDRYLPQAVEWGRDKVGKYPIL